jgi:hypothetical protein
MPAPIVVRYNPQPQRRPYAKASRIGAGRPDRRRGASGDLVRGRADRPGHRRVAPTSDRSDADQSAGARVRLDLGSGCGDGSAPGVAPVGPTAIAALTSFRLAFWAPLPWQ